MTASLMRKNIENDRGLCYNPFRSEQGDGSWENIAKPTKQQLDWHELELGVLIHYCLEMYRPDLMPLLQKYQPDAICFQGPKAWPHNVRWVGNEDGLAPENC